jgi:hypothetical protein
MASKPNYKHKPAGATLADRRGAHPNLLAQRAHVVPLGGIPATTDYAAGLWPRTERVRA